MHSKRPKKKLLFSFCLFVSLNFSKIIHLWQSNMRHMQHFSFHELFNKYQTESCETNSVLNHEIVIFLEMIVSGHQLIQITDFKSTKQLSLFVWFFFLTFVNAQNAKYLPTSERMLSAVYVFFLSLQFSQRKTHI